MKANVVLICTSCWLGETDPAVLKQQQTQVLMNVEHSEQTS